MLKNIVTTMKKMAKEENVPTSIVFRVIKRFRKVFSIEWKKQKKSDQEHGTEPWTRGMQVLQEISYTSNVMFQKIWVLSIRRSTELGRNKTKRSIKSKYFQKKSPEQVSWAKMRA